MTIYNIGPGQTYETFTTLITAITLAPGDIVDGGGNTFNETWIPNASGNLGNYITLRNAIIDGQNTRLGCINGGSKSYIITQNITTKDTTGSNNYGIKTYNYWRIINCNASNHTFGFRCNATVESSVENCVATNCGYNASFYGSTGGTVNGLTATATTAANVLFVDGTFTGVLQVENVSILGGIATYANIDLRNSAFGDGSYIKDTTIEGKGGIYAYNISNITFENVTAINNELAGFSILGTSHDITFSNCIAASNGLLSNVGYRYSSSYNLTFNDCLAFDNYGDGFTAINECHDIVHNRCKSISNAVRNPSPGSDGDGFTSHDTCYNLDYFFCFAGENANSAFAMAETSAGRIINCSSYKNGNLVNTIRSGYWFVLTGENAIADAGRTSWIVKNCIGYLDYPKNVSVSTAAKSIIDMDYNCYLSIDSDSFGAINDKGSGGTRISWDTYHATYEANSIYSDSLLTSDGKITTLSPCIDAGTTIAGVTDIGALDPWGNATNRTPNIGADQASDENFYRKDAGFDYGQGSYTVRVKKILPTA